MPLKSLLLNLYFFLILNPDSNPIPSLPDPLNTKLTPSSHTWPRLFLLKPHTSFFSNTEKEIAFRTAYKGYAWGSFFKKHLIPPRFRNYSLCKLCSSSTDDPHHLFFECPGAKYLISRLEPILSEILKSPLLSIATAFIIISPI